MSKHFVTININGSDHSMYVDSSERLIDILRDRLQLKSVKEGCGTGDCGLCTVVLNGQIVNSCLILAPQCRGKKIFTLEGLLEDPIIKKLQEKFQDFNAAQCGFCTPAMIIAAKSILQKNPKPSIEDIKVGISGVLCRCTGYNSIIRAIKSTSSELEI